MILPSHELLAWRRTRQGLAFARRGIALVATSGVLILFLGALGRAGCSDPALPEVRSLLAYQDLVFHAALWLGFTVVVGGLMWASFLPGSLLDRLVPAGSGALAAAALLLVSYVATPGALPSVNGPPGHALQLVGAVLGTAALSSSALVVMRVARRLTAPSLWRGSVFFGPALLVVAAVNAEAASSLVFPGPLAALYSMGFIAVVNAVACFYLVRLIRESETVIDRHLAGTTSPPGASDPCPGLPEERPHGPC